MSKFLTGRDLEEKLTDIIWEAKKYVLIVSPFIKLDNHVKKIFDKIKFTSEIHLILLFGKNEGYKEKSFNKEDFDYFKEFKNISILYNKDLHAKHYCNESEALVTSLNLYDYSMVNNIEYGIHFTKNYLNLTDKLFDETAAFTDELVFEKSDVVFVRKPVYKKKLLGLSKSYVDSNIVHDISDDFFNNRKYKIVSYADLDIEDQMDIEKAFEEKPVRKKVDSNNPIQKTGFCIRTGEQIPFNPERPFSYKAFKQWDKFKNENYPEKYCHKTGKESDGKTSKSNPIL